MNTYFVGITTYMRFPYLTKLIESLKNTISDNNKYIIAINDDGSNDGTVEYLQKLTFANNVEYHFLQTKLGCHGAVNNVLLFSLTKEFDFGFKIDDDLVFLKSGWDDLYYNCYKENGYPHLSHFSLNWEQKKKEFAKGNLVAYCDVSNSQGAFYTYTKEVLEKIGFIDNNNLGVRGEGHRDFSMRACRLGFNDWYNFFDSKKGNDYIKLHPKKGYLKTPNYNNIIKGEIEDMPRKRAIMNQENRIYCQPLPSVLNYFFDKIFVINLKRRPDRLKHITKVLNDLNAEFEVIEAVDGNNEQELFLKSKKTYSNVTHGVIGCHLSHLKVYKEIKAKSYKRALILEDDLIPSKNINELKNNLFKIDNNWDFLHLGSADENHKENLKTFDGIKYIGKNVNSTFAYSVNANIIDELISEFEKLITKPCDTLLHSFQKNTYVMYPNLFTSLIEDSDIRERKNPKKYIESIGLNINDFEFEKYTVLKNPKVGIYISDLKRVGGVETHAINLANRTGYDLIVNNFDVDILNKVKSDIYAYKYITQKYDVLIISSATGTTPDNILTDKYIQVIHANFTDYKNLIDWNYNKLPYTTHHVCVGETIRKAFEKETNLKCDKVIYNLLDHSENIAKTKSDKLSFITLTRFSKVKGIERIIKLAEKLKKEDYIWNIYGNIDTTLGKSFREQIKKYPQIKLHGVTQEPKKEILKHDYLIQLSDTEGFSYSIYESLQCLTPVICTDFESAHELIKNGKNGFILKMDLSNFDFEKIKKIPKIKSFKEKSNENDWTNFINEIL